MVYILGFKAGKLNRREGTNFLDADPTKGAILLQKDDDLLHFLWKNRATDDVEEDLILFPGDATFERVTQSPGRVYVLKFSSSDQKHFFYLQDANTSRDNEFIGNLNRVLENPDIIPVWSSNDAEPSGSNAQASTSQAGASTGPSADQLQQIRELVAQYSQNNDASAQPEISLNDVLTPQNIQPLFTSHPELIPALFPHLPPDLPVPPSPEAVRQIINSPQFRAAVRNLDQALRTGLLGNLVTALGLPAEAGTGVEAFLRAVQEQARRQGRDSSGGGGGSRSDDNNMQTD